MGIITDILKELPLSAIMKERLIDTEKKMSILEKENTDSKSKINILESELQKSKLVINQQIKKIEAFEKLSHSTSLNKIEEKILIILSNQQNSLTTEDITQFFDLNFQVISFHLEELEKQKMVHCARSPMGDPHEWSLIQGGRKYLIDNKLIKT